MVSKVNTKSVGPIALAPGVEPRNLYAFVASALVGISVIVFINFLQPYLLTTQLQVPQNTQGRVVSSLSILQEVIALVLAPPLGRLSDRIGRRIILAAGLSILAIGLLAYPLATTLLELAVARAVTAVGAAAFAATLATIAADYPSNRSRGKLLSALLVTQQLAIFLVVAKVAAHLPYWLAGLGVNAIDAGHDSFWLVAGLSAVGAVIAMTGLKRGGPESMQPNGASPTVRSIVASLRRMIAYAKNHPRFTVVLAMAFVVRGDASVINTFLSLWAVSAAKRQGLSASIGLRNAGALLSYITISGLAGALLTGWLADRYNRLKLLIVTLAVATIAHLCVFWISDLQSLQAAFVICLLGAGEMSLVVAGQALLGQEAPAAARGAAIGFFGFFGSLGVLSINLAGGFLFDKISFQAPFVLIGAINLSILAWTLFVRKREVISAHTLSNLKDINACLNPGSSRRRRF